jgi:hypothetical protein
MKNISRDAFVFMQVLVVTGELLLLANIALVISFSGYGFSLYDLSPAFLISEAVLLASLGGLAGLRTVTGKGWLWKALAPDRRKAMYSLLISALFVMLPFLAIPADMLLEYLSSPGSEALWYELGFSVLVYAFLFYPFSGLAMATHEARKGSELRGRKPFSLAVGINPIFVGLALTVNIIILVTAMTFPCGVTFEGFLQESPARDAGMKAGDVITSINGIPVSGVVEMGDMLDGIPGNSSLSVGTSDGTTYSMVRYYNETEGRYLLGISQVSTHLCMKNMGY